MADKETRIKKFFAEYEQLVKKYNVDVMAYPVFVPDGIGTFKVSIESRPVELEPKAKESFITK